MKKILIICEYFYPGYKAGGPIQSLVNLIELLAKTHQISVYTSAYDLGAVHPYKNIEVDAWNEVSIGSISCSVFYSSKPTVQQHIQVVNHIQPHWVYINGMYLPRILAFALWVRKSTLATARYMIAPRGMLQPGAMANKRLQKKLYLFCLQSIGLFRNCYWHATHISEQSDIKNEIGEHAMIRIAENIPKIPLSLCSLPKKEKGSLHLVYVSIISAKKNLLGLLQVLQLVNSAIHLTIYGPIKDVSYWEACEAAIQNMPAHVVVSYRGDLEPHLVQSTIAEYHALVLLTKGENFGHAIFESLSVGRPVLISHSTPWNALMEDHAGWNLDINNQEAIKDQLEACAYMEQIEWESWCKGALQKAHQYFYHERDFDKEYESLFS